MNVLKKNPGLGFGLLAPVLLAAFGPAHAQEDETAKLTKPESSISVGVAGVSGDSKERARFGHYSGLRKDDFYGILDFDVNRRDDGTGLWTTFGGRNLGLEIPELRFGQQKQGDWKYALQYDEVVRNYPNTINTNLQGIGTTALIVTRTPQGTGSDVDLKTKRERFTLDVEKWLSPRYQVEVNFRNEEKTGARIHGRGFNCSAGFGCVAGGGTSPVGAGAILLLPQPINYTMRSVDAKVNYSGEKFMLSGAYYGSFFNNSNGSYNQTFNGLLYNPNFSALNPAVVGGNSLAVAMGNPLALQPDNQSHQFSLAGNYAFSKATRTNFKLSYTHLTQNEDFSSMGFTGALPRSNFGGKVDTTLAQWGLSSNLTQKLKLLTNLRVENRSDKSPIEVYTAAGRTNGRTSLQKINGKVEMSYLLPANYRATFGADLEMKDWGRPFGTNDFSGQASAIRQKTQELGWRAELRKSMSETVTGAVSVGRSFRSGTTWMTTANTAAQGTTQPDDVIKGGGFNLFPLMQVNLSRDKIKGVVDWSITDNWSVQVGAEEGREHYYAPSLRGARDGASRLFNVDTSYAISNKWRATGYYTHGDSILDINGNNNAYSEGMRMLNNSVGMNLKGNPSERIEVGGNVLFSYETNRYAQGVVAGITAQPKDLPAVAYRQTILSLFGKYALDKKSGVRLDFVHASYYTNEWYWSNAGVPFFYSDGTTVTQQGTQSVNMLKASYIYKWQ